MKPRRKVYIISYWDISNDIHGIYGVYTNRKKAINNKPKDNKVLNIQYFLEMVLLNRSYPGRVKYL